MSWIELSGGLAYVAVQVRPAHGKPTWRDCPTTTLMRSTLIIILRLYNLQLESKYPNLRQQN